MEPVDTIDLCFEDTDSRYYHSQSHMLDFEDSSRSKPINFDEGMNFVDNNFAHIDCINSLSISKYL